MSNNTPLKQIVEPITNVLKQPLELLCSLPESDRQARAVCAWVAKLYGLSVLLVVVAVVIHVWKM